MWLSFNLSALSLKQLVNGSCQAVGYHAGSASLGVVVSFLTQRFSDQSQRLAKSNRHAWHALEVALAGEGLWDRCKRLLSSADEKAFREHLQPFLNGCPMAELEGREAYRARCLRELRLAAKSGILKETSFDPEQIAKKVGAFAQFNDPLKIIEAENELLGQMSQELSKAGHENLASLISIRPNQGDPVLVTAARYFFRRLVEEDAVLFRELAFAQLETLKCSQDQAFSSLQSILEGHLDKLEQIFDQLQQTHEVVLDLREEQQRQGAQADQIYQQVVDLQAKLDLVHSEIRPRDSLSIRNEQERRLVRDLVGRYRELPEQQREQLPALLRPIGNL